MSRRSLIVGAVSGVSVGLVVALSMSYVDWRHNPQGIFHDGSGTDWGIVLDTATSWFVPVALIVFVLSTAVHSWLSRP